MADKRYVNLDNTAYIWEKIKNLFVAKETGKGLSEANYTQTEKAKLANIADGAEVNVNADWNAVTGDAAILNKPTIPDSLTDLENDGDFVQDANYTHITVDGTVSDQSTNPISNAAIKAYIDQLIQTVSGFHYEKVTQLPQTGEGNVIYLVPNSGSGSNLFDEYIWIVVDNVGSFEKFGTTDIDLSGYQLSSELVALTTAEIDTICV